MKKVVLVGELNPYGSDPSYALWDEPDGSAGSRLRRILGLWSHTYRTLTRVNLCRRTWSTACARESAESLVAGPPSTIVLLGRRVASAFRYREPFFTWGARGVHHLVSLPHPSGRCRLWNESGRVEEVLNLLRYLVPGVPWGEEPDSIEECRSLNEISLSSRTGQGTQGCE